MIVRLFLSLSLLVAAMPAWAEKRGPASEVPTQAKRDAAMRAMMDEIATRTLEAGPAETGWSDRGVDIMAVLARAPGGVAGNYLLSHGEDGTDVTMIDRPELPALPAAWQPLWTKGERAAGQGTSIDIAALSKGQYIVSVQSIRRVGNALCAKGMGGLAIYHDPAVQEDEETRFMMLMIPSLADAIGDREICTRYDQVEPGIYRTRMYTADGRPLINLNDEADQERIGIVPAAPLEDLLKSTDRQ